ncbi:uncharacterized protein [Dermacentor andersoni]|uniref:uncharacterized protein n=1 Tax=Dermacentor andersoni TaxID=34620 RepID=UPI002416D62D|nr:uncharacterized protein LOC129385380 [Dermacentor andersoni]
MVTYLRSIKRLKNAHFGKMSACLHIRFLFFLYVSLFLRRNINGSIAYDKANVVKALEALFQKGLVHFGMLNVYNLQDYDALKNGDFKYLTVVTEFLMKKQGDKPKYFCALGAGINDGPATTTYLDLVKKAVTDFPGITMMVLRVHTELIKTVEERYTAGPNPDSLTLVEYNTLTLNMIAKDLRSRLEEMILGRQFYAMLSFGMYARAFTMSPNWTIEEERTLAWNTTIMDYRLACLMGAPRRDHVDTGSSYSADVANHFLAIFDTTEDCETKITERMALHLPKQPTGIMAYHVELDDFNNVCNEGAFARIKKIRDKMYTTKPRLKRA